MTQFNNFVPADYNYINDLYFAYKKNPASEEAGFALNEALGYLAYAIAPEYPTREDDYGNASDIYLLLHDLTMSSAYDNFLEAALKAIDEEF